MSCFTFGRVQLPNTISREQLGDFAKDILKVAMNYGIYVAFGAYVDISVRNVIMQNTEFKDKELIFSISNSMFENTAEEILPSQLLGSAFYNGVDSAPNVQQKILNMKGFMVAIFNITKAIQIDLFIEDQGHSIPDDFTTISCCVDNFNDKLTEIYAQENSEFEFPIHLVIKQRDTRG